MVISEINEVVFEEFANKHMLKNFLQTKEYGHFMEHSDYHVVYIGAYKDDKLVAASLVLWKVLSAGIKYGYAPRGFLIDYFDTPLLEEFTKAVKKYFNKKHFAFIKINPEVVYANLDYDIKAKEILPKSRELVATLRSLGYIKLKDHLYFESLLPRYTPVIYLPKYNFDALNKQLIDKLRDDELSGIVLKKGNENDIDTFFSFLEGKTAKSASYYKTFYKYYNQSNKADIILVTLDYQIYVKYLQKQFAYEQVNNDKVNSEFRDNPNSEELYNKKMESDKLLNKLSYDIIKANNVMSSGEVPKEVLGSAFVLKHQGRATIFISGCNKDFNGVDVKTYMYYKLIKDYKDDGFEYLDLYGITADFNDNNPYKDLNDFKLKFEPDVYEYIGEFDLIINKALHHFLWTTNKIQKEFYKSTIR